MSKKLEHGGPAFPCSSLSDGITVRDYFAASALAGILANANGVSERQNAPWLAYQQAELMLAQKEAAEQRVG